MQRVFLEATLEALRAVTARRFFRSERGYQGRFYCALQAALDRRGVLQDGIILEMEYQKGSRHNMSQRPDIILHVPAEETGSPVKANNFAVWALKRQASVARALNDFQKLDEMCHVLRYPLAVFINVDSQRHHLENYAGSFPHRLHGFAVWPEKAAICITHGWREGNTLKETAE